MGRNVFDDEQGTLRSERSAQVGKATGEVGGVHQCLDRHDGVVVAISGCIEATNVETAVARNAPAHGLPCRNALLYAAQRQSVAWAAQLFVKREDGSAEPAAGIEHSCAARQPRSRE